jgi:hypothetical protein
VSALWLTTSHLFCKSELYSCSPALLFQSPQSCTVVGSSHHGLLLSLLNTPEQMLMDYLLLVPLVHFLGYGCCGVQE